MRFTSEVEIWNLALSRMGHVKVQHASERSRAAIECRHSYPVIIGMFLEEFDWSFARSHVTLAKLDEAEAVDGWLLAYAWPTNAVAIRRIRNPFAPPLSGSRSYYDPYALPPVIAQYPAFDGNDPIVPFEIMRRDDDGTMKILCDMPDAEARVTMDVSADVSTFPMTFVNAVAYELQADLTMSITKDANKAVLAKQLRSVAWDIATTSNHNQAHPRRKSVPRSIAARG